MPTQRKQDLEHDAVVTALKRYLPLNTEIQGIRFGDELVGYVVAGVGYIGVREPGVDQRLRKAIHK